MNKILIFILMNSLLLAKSASIFDYLTGDPESRDETKKNCICNGPSCICCLDFNMSFIDLGGPGCVRMNYISADAGIAINVSYGDSMLHSAMVKGPDPEPTCLNIFAKIAQMCARFSELLPTDDGLRGCVNLEPMLMGEVQLELPVGCFRMGPNGMQMIQSQDDLIKEQQLKEEELKQETVTNSDGEDSTLIGGYNPVDILSAVNDSAEEGIALISQWLGITSNQNETIESAENDTTTQANTPTHIDDNVKS